MITPQDRFDAALRRLHEALTEQINKLDHDIATAAARKLHVLHYDLCGLRTRLYALLDHTSAVLDEHPDLHLGEALAEFREATTGVGVVFRGVKLTVPSPK